jgi:hypothetical protein
MTDIELYTLAAVVIILVLAAVYRLTHRPRGPRREP